MLTSNLQGLARPVLFRQLISQCAQTALDENFTRHQLAADAAQRILRVAAFGRGGVAVVDDHGARQTRQCLQILATCRFSRQQGRTDQAQTKEKMVTHAPP